MTTTALVKVDGGQEVAVRSAEPVARGLMRPIARPAEVLEVLEETRAMLAKTLVDGVDFGVIPGTDKDKNKPAKKVLQKPGAEKICFAFGVRPAYEVIEQDVDHERVMRFKSPWVEAPDPGFEAKKRLKEEGKGKSRKVDGEWAWFVPGDGLEETTGLYRYVLRCKLVRHDGVVVGEGVGSCSSLESKYRSRPHDVENTVLKMAKKRAFVDAVLTSFGLSEAFTADLIDGPDDEGADHGARSHARPSPPPMVRTSPPPRTEDTPRTPTPAKGADPLAAVKRAAWAELERLRIGVGLESKDDVKVARLNAVKRVNGGTDPTTLAEWTAVVEALKSEADPEIIEDAPPSD